MEFSALPKIALVTFTALLPVINPLGTAIILVSLTPAADGTTRKLLARIIGINTVIILSLLLIGGSYILSFFGISVPIVQVAGGLVLASMGWKMLNDTNGSSKSSDESAQNDPKEYFAKSFYPYTFPITVGPGCIAVIFTLSAHTTQGGFEDTALHQFASFMGIIAIGIVTYASIAYSTTVVKRVKPSILNALMRMVAFIVVCIGGEITWSGISALHP